MMYAVCVGIKTVKEKRNGRYVSETQKTGTINTGGITNYLISSVDACRTEVNGIAKHKNEGQGIFRYIGLGMQRIVGAVIEKEIFEKIMGYTEKFGNYSSSSISE